MKAHALAMVVFPTRPRNLEPHDARDLAITLQQIGRAVAAGHHPNTGTILVPFQERSAMKVSLDIAGPQGKMWDFDMNYHRLPLEYATQIGLTARSFASYIEHLAGGANQGDKAYVVRFKYEADGDAVRAAGEVGGLLKGSATSRSLLYSEAVGVQDAGIKLLQDLLEGARMEIASGERK